MEDQRQQKRFSEFFKTSRCSGVSERSSEYFVSLRKKQKTEIFKRKRLSQMVEPEPSELIPAKDFSEKLKKQTPIILLKNCEKILSCIEITDDTFDTIFTSLRIIESLIENFSGNFSEMFSTVHDKTKNSDFIGFDQLHRALTKILDLSIKAPTSK